LIWFVRDFDLLSLLLRALSFALEALAYSSCSSQRALQIWIRNRRRDCGASLRASRWRWR
jgi:hypothetical protein